MVRRLLISGLPYKEIGARMHLPVSRVKTLAKRLGYGRYAGSLTPEEQDRITLLRAEGYSLSEVARRMQRAESTVAQYCRRHLPGPDERGSDA